MVDTWQGSYDPSKYPGQPHMYMDAIADECGIRSQWPAPDPDPSTLHELPDFYGTYPR